MSRFRPLSREFVSGRSSMDIFVCLIVYSSLVGTWELIGFKDDTMRFSSNFFALNPSLLLWTFIALSSHINASSQDPLRQTPQLLFGTYEHSSPNVNGRSWISRVRDHVIETIWRVPSDNDLGRADCRASATPGPPSTLVARYGGDLVLRFEIRSIEEAEALAEAINVLFLDVWEFTTGWVDIRLSKDVVSVAPSRGPGQFVADLWLLRSHHYWVYYHPRSSTPTLL